MRALVLGLVIAALPAGVAQAAVEESTSDRLPDRREVAAGTRAYSVGFEDGRFYANGWHILGEMGGIWTPPLKLADGVWFGVDGQWAGPATKFTSGRGYVRYDLPALSGLNLRRVDFVPDGRRAVVYGLNLANPDGRARTATVMVDVHSELMSAYPWSSTTPSVATDLQDTVTYQDGALVFRDQGTPDGREPHDWAALVASPDRPTAHETGDGHRGPQPGTICHDGDQTAPKGCDDGPFGKGTGGQLQYRVTVPARGERTVWIAVAGSDRGVAVAQDELAKAIDDPQAQLRAKVASRARLASRSRVDLPGDRTLEHAVDWGKQNLADLTQTATDLKIRFVDQGKAYPDPVGTVDHATFIGAGYPDYPWMFATDGEYTAFAAVAVGQFEAIKAHLIALRDVSDLLNQRSGKVAHEVVTDGSVYFGANTDPGNTDETVKFPSALALVWRWTGDDRFLDELYDFAVRNLRYVATHLDEDGDGWPEGLGNVERAGMGEEKLDNTVYYIRGLYDLADLARAQHDRATERWATRTVRDLQARFDPTWWDGTQYADSLDNPGNVRVQQKHWIGVTPMSADIAPAGHARAALAERETDCYSGFPPYNRGLFHTGCNGGPEGKGERTIFSLNTAIQAVGEGNYGRLGAGQQQRYTSANADPMFEPDEMPGALPEILPSPDFGDRDDNDRNLDRCWSCRAMFMQAWGHYGTAWPVIHQQLGVRPSLGTGELAVVPQIPDGQHWLGGDAIRLGDGGATVVAQRFGSRYATSVTL
ncbi:MAG TPA: hypothetical protein VFG79_20720, partial [Solirubrobacter sp.]|nr:hypothetical protein [Solirubrobacter sp.]